MKIEYKDTHVFTEKELQRLFLSVEWGPEITPINSFGRCKILRM